MFYDYICDECGFKDNYSHKMMETPEILCPTCNFKMRKELGLNYTVKCDGFYSSKSSTGNAQKITQTVMGVDENRIGELDAKTQRATRAKPVDPV